MSWLKRIYTEIPSPSDSGERIDTSTVPETGVEVYAAQLKGNSDRSSMEIIAEEREQEAFAQASETLVVDGAKIQMGAHVGEFSVNAYLPTVQGKHSGTISAKHSGNFIFYDGFSVIDIIGDWRDYGTCKLQDREVLLLKSSLAVQGKMPGNSPLEAGVIRFLDSGQVTIPPYIGHGEAAPLPANEPLDFDVGVEHGKADFVPLGIPDFKGNREQDKIRFNLRISGKGIDGWFLTIKNKGVILQELSSSSIAVFTSADVAQANGLLFLSKAKEEPQQQERLWAAGEYSILWDGFDADHIYNSKILTQGNGLTAYFTAWGNGKKMEVSTGEFRYSYKQVKWVDVIINRKTAKIDLFLRLNLFDAGAVGLERPHVEPNHPEVGGSKAGYPWEKIPPKQLLTLYPPIKTRTRSFDDLLLLALKGVNYHWSRNEQHSVGKNVKIDNVTYGVNIQAIRTDKDAMEPLGVHYTTNEKWRRSSNPGAITEDPLTAEFNSRMKNVLCYNVGYIHYPFGWAYQNGYDEDLNFMELAAHEVGHEILKFYAGALYSYGHKGSSTIWSQEVKPEMPNYPISGEIDTMCYYQNYIPPWEHKRSVAAENDVLGLIWLTQLKSL